jgi:galactose mutarotase-like enzyme
VKLLGGPWALEVSPERGGRITSVRLRGEELLDQGIGVDDPGADGFVAAGAWGWDEMVPTVEAATYPGPGAWFGTQLPDHGEAWRLPWTVLEESGDFGSMECSGHVLPWKVRRRIELTESAVRLAYTFTNQGRHSMYAYWCAHPLFRYETGMEIGVEGGETMAHMAEGTSAKRFLRRASVDRVRLKWASGAAIEIAWDSENTPYVGVWVCNGDLGGYRQIAIEPATGGGDRPHLAVPPPLLPAGDELSWWLEIRVVQPAVRQAAEADHS